MRASLPSFDCRGLPLRFSSLVLAGSTLLAACDSERPLSPTATTTPPTANPVINANVGALRITILDQNNALPTTAGSQFTVAPVCGGKTYFVVDNAPPDSHALIGSVLVGNLKAGFYTVCQTIAPAGYVLPTSPSCQPYPIEIVAGTSTLADASHVQFGILTAAHLQRSVGDMLNQPIGGAVFTATYQSGVDTIPDNSAKDLDKNPGRVEIKLTDPGVTVCSLTPPKHYMFATPFPSNCFGLTPLPGQTTYLTNYIVHPEFSVFWYAQDVNGFAGPSTYEVSGGASGTFFATIVDEDKIRCTCRTRSSACRCRTRISTAIKGVRRRSDPFDASLPAWSSSARASHHPKSEPQVIAAWCLRDGPSLYCGRRSGPAHQCAAPGDG